MKYVLRDVNFLLIILKYPLKDFLDFFINNSKIIFEGRGFVLKKNLKYPLKDVDFLSNNCEISFEGHGFLIIILKYLLKDVIFLDNNSKISFEERGYFKQ